MTSATFTSLLGYMLVCSFTPGPGNILALNTTSTYGWKRSRSLILGICLGYAICGINGTTFASTVTDYEENAVALFCDDAAYLLYLFPRSSNKYKFGICSCSRELLSEYARQYPLKNHSQFPCIYEQDNLQAIRIDYP